MSTGAAASADGGHLIGVQDVQPAADAPGRQRRRQRTRGRQGRAAEQVPTHVSGVLMFSAFSTSLRYCLLGGDFVVSTLQV